MKKDLGAVSVKKLKKFTYQLMKNWGVALSTPPAASYAPDGLHYLFKVYFYSYEQVIYPASNRWGRGQTNESVNSKRTVIKGRVALFLRGDWETSPQNI